MPGLDGRDAHLQKLGARLHCSVGLYICHHRLRTEVGSTAPVAPAARAGLAALCHPGRALPVVEQVEQPYRLAPEPCTQQLLPCSTTAGEQSESCCRQLRALIIGEGAPRLGSLLHQPMQGGHARACELLHDDYPELDMGRVLLIDHS